jgi:hypothetical protein
MLGKFIRNKGPMLVFLAIVVSISVPIMQAESTGYSVTVDNASSFGIYQLYLSPANSNSWGPDFLGRYALLPGYNATTVRIPAGTYDLKLVDQDGDSCVVPNVYIGQRTNWRITDTWLLNCEFH